jgi:hypothetical protein
MRNRSVPNHWSLLQQGITIAQLIPGGYEAAIGTTIWPLWTMLYTALHGQIRPYEALKDLTWPFKIIQRGLMKP